MYSYHIVAELRQFRGVSATAAGASTGLRFPTTPNVRARPSRGTDWRDRGLMAMDRFFLAMMVSAVLLLIVAADRLVNSPGMQQSANVANVLPAAPARLIR
ncbi:hypothetical protein AXW67_20620 [Bradyrhizobium neotropicale]|uniref:Uncharacterized protein n=2 Tax=Nitrobacteraceae TaxID=41294 RepID=A0A176YYZ2_9BRAD|nr:hypothetical protein AXW67_20620 [Bradyrhizobium neotropicale]